MDLNLCPECDAFVARDWTSCRSCGSEIVPVAPDTESESPMPGDELLDSGVDAPSEPAEETISSYAWEAADSPAVDHHLVESIAADQLVTSESAIADLSTSTETWSAADTRRDAPLIIDTPTAAQAAFGNASAFSTADTPDGPNEGHFGANGSRAGNHFASEDMSSWTAAGQQSTGSDDGSVSPAWVGNSFTITDTKVPFKLLLKIAGSVTAVIVVGLVLVSVFVTGGKEGTAGPSTSTSVTSATTHDTKWVNYFDPAGRYKVDLPANPSVTPQQVNGLDATVAQADSPDGRSTIVITAADVPGGQDWSKNDQALRDALDASAASTNAKIKSAVFTTVEGHRELNAHMTVDGAVYDARYFVDHGTLYVILVASHHNDGDPTTFSRVTETFRTLR